MGDYVGLKTIEPCRAEISTPLFFCVLPSKEPREEGVKHQPRRVAYQAEPGNYLFHKSTLWGRADFWWQDKSTNTEFSSLPYCGYRPHLTLFFFKFLF